MASSELAALTEDEIKSLIAKSKAAKEHAHAPYSNFQVGAALLAKDGRIFTGCNVENSAYPLGTCAERCAIVKAVSEGCKEFKAIAIATNIPDKFASPCGGCRQIISEFGNYWIIVTKPDDSYRQCTISELLPSGFNKIDLEAGQNK